MTRFLARRKLRQQTILMVIDFYTRNAQDTIEAMFINDSAELVVEAFRDMAKKRHSLEVQKVGEEVHTEKEVNAAKEKRLKTGEE